MRIPPRLAALVAKLRRRDQYVEIRDDAREYVCNGDNVWGDSITWSQTPTEEDWTCGRVVGWVSVKPRPGDVVICLMKGGWSRWIVQTVEHAQGVSDMFFADVRGLVNYLHETGDEPPDRKCGAMQRIPRNAFGGLA